MWWCQCHHISGIYLSYTSTAVDLLNVWMRYCNDEPVRIMYAYTYHITILMWSLGKLSKYRYASLLKELHNRSISLKSDLLARSFSYLACKKNPEDVSWTFICWWVSVFQFNSLITSQKKESRIQLDGKPISWG